MKYPITKLKTIWQNEKDFYRKAEAGTGVQSFVKKILESEEFFKLKEGRLSTGLEQRKNEFIHEKKAKEKRKADFVIYINPEIVIPVEVECYGNIKIGESQLFKYQKDFDKQYGILTDGYSWRFYNNNIFRTFTLNDIFDRTSLFLEFWSEYIKPEFYYLSFFETAGQLALLEKTKLHVEKNRQLFFEDITKRIESFKNKLQLEGYLKDLDGKEREKRAIEVTYAYIIQFILYKTLVDNEFGKFRDEFKKNVKKIHEHIKTKRYKDILGIIDGISAQISKNIYRPFTKEQDFIRQKLLELYQSIENKLSDISPWLDIFVFVKKYNFTNVQNEIFGYIYENYLKELYQEEQKGQYFTDPIVVNFMLEQIGFSPDKLRKRHRYDKNSISLIDPACGSGTFLYSAVDRIIKAFGNHSVEKSKQVETVVNNNIFGLDIAEFPLYLAEMNILMRMLPMIISEKYNNPVDKKIKVFLTKDSIAEFMDTALRNTLHDQTVEFQKKADSSDQILMFTEKLDLGYKSYVRKEDDLEEMKRSLENLPRIPRRRFDYVIGNPPYISYNKASKQKVLVVKLIQEKKAQMSNIYGVNLNTVPGRIKPYSPKPNLYAFFIALGIALLKDNGKLCYIIPQTVLTAGDLDVVRYHLAKFTTIEKIITFAGKMFVGRGLEQNKPIPTSSLIFVLNRRMPPLLHKVEIINYKNSNDDIEETLKNVLINKNIGKKKILQTKLLQNVANWNFIKQSRKFLDSYTKYKRNSIDISMFRTKLNAEKDFSFDGGVIIDKEEITNSPTSNCFEIFDYKNNDWNLYTISKSYKYYPKNSPFKFPSGSQGLAAFEKKFKIFWRTRFAKNFQFTDKNIILINNQSLVVGSNSKKELFFYFALLNSPINKTILEKNLKQENEKDYFIPLKAIKEFVRIPKITQDNQFIKDEVVKRTEEMLTLEEKTLSNFVDFSRVMVQKFDKILIKKSVLVLKKNGRQIELTIKGNRNLVKKVVGGKYSEKELELEPQKITLSELKSLPAVDFEKQKRIKDYIDDLVFCLYFNIQIPRAKLSEPEFVKNLCTKNKFYSQLG